MSEPGGLKVGLILQSLRLPVDEALEKAASLGVDGIQVYVTSGELLAENMDAAARKAFSDRCEGLGIQISALCAEYGKNYGVEEQAEWVLPRIEAALEQAADLGTGVVTTHIGAIPEQRSAPAWSVFARTLNSVGRCAERCGVNFAIETGPEPGHILRDMIESLDTGGVGANFDPANLVMKGYDHIQAARDLAAHIAHTHAKDGKRGEGEVPLGQGDVDFPRYVAVMREIGYEGFFTIERESGPDPIKDVSEAVDFLRRL